MTPGVVQIITPDGGTGTGFVIASDGRIVTNEHVVGGHSRVTVRIPGVGSYNGRVLGVDAIADLAIVDIDDGIGFTVLDMGDSDSLSIGENVVAMGFPLDGSPTITRGVVSSVREFDGVEHVQTDAAINPGNSGGPLFNEAGEVIGVNTSTYEKDGERIIDGISFAVSVNEVKKRLDSLARGYDVLSNTPTPQPFSTPAPTFADTYQNGKYGYSVDIASGWTLDEDDEADDYASFWTSDNIGLFSVSAYDLSDSDSLKEFADWYRDEVESYAQFYNVFEIMSFRKIQEGDREFYEIRYRWQDSAESCVSSDTERIFLSSSYPNKPHGFVITAGICEEQLHRYSEDTDAMFASFTEWEIYQNSKYGYTMNIAPGWTLDEEGETDTYASFWAPSNKGLFSIRAYDLSSDYTLREFAEWYRDDLKDRADEDSSEVFEITSFQKRRENGREFYWLAYRRQNSIEYCVSSRVAIVALSSFYPNKPYGYVVSTGVCEGSLDLYDRDRLDMLDGFRY